MTLLMPFLYFPEDKSEYIPSFIVLGIFMILAVFATIWFFKKSKKDEREFNNKYNIKETDSTSGQNK
ncbi:hypothetical protein CIL03_09650 [Virgibacillus indicus]|uniref:Uncharacterized protein n=1 Tax=Virgibacillus indicus TaxID=2024554 RepID=A0A265N975_9BACI|nr:hypothetical protein [Virgibacillus indicus]OZU88558.1 hypothetical protein CIL03_09650 [Virgibacillus indicus]